MGSSKRHSIFWSDKQEQFRIHHQEPALTRRTVAATQACLGLIRKMSERQLSPKLEIRSTPTGSGVEGNAIYIQNNGITFEKIVLTIFSNYINLGTLHVCSTEKWHFWPVTNPISTEMTGKALFVILLAKIFDCIRIGPQMREIMKMDSLNWVPGN